jgi:hypothetical protein
MQFFFFLSFLNPFPNVDLANAGNIFCSVLPPRQDKQLAISNRLVPTGQRPDYCASILPHDFGVS